MTGPSHVQKFISVCKPTRRDSVASGFSLSLIRESRSWSNPPIDTSDCVGDSGRRNLLLGQVCSSWTSRNKNSSNRTCNALSLSLILIFDIVNLDDLPLPTGNGTNYDPSNSGDRAPPPNTPIFPAVLLLRAKIICFEILVLWVIAIYILYFRAVCHFDGRAAGSPEFLDLCLWLYHQNTLMHVYMVYHHTPKLD